MSTEPAPFVTIIVPVYNGERYLRDSLDSIIAQTYTNLEILVMDDASNDESPGIIASCGDKIKSYRQLKNVGQFANVNSGISRAGGEYIAVYHADDIYDPKIVETEVKYLQNYPEAGAVFCKDIFIGADGHEYNRLKINESIKTGSPLSYPDVLNAMLTFKNVFLVGPTAMVRSSVYQDVGTYQGDEFHIASDLEMWMRIAKKYPVLVIDEYLHQYRHDHGNLSQNYYHLRTEAEIHFRIMDMHLGEGGNKLATPEAIAAHEAHRNEDLLMVAINHYIKNDRQNARKCLQRIRILDLIGSSRIQRWRLLILLLMMRVLVHLPYNAWISDVFYKHWHGNKTK